MRRGELAYAARAPIALLLLLAGVALTAAAAASAEPLSPGAVHAAVGAPLPRGLALLLQQPRSTRMERARQRAEASFLDFVELFWPLPEVEGDKPFVRGKVQEAIALHLEAVSAGLITKLMCNVPPGSTKSLLVDVFWPAWEWGPRNRPDLRYMSWSYSPELTLEHNDLCRKIIKSELYQRFWGDRFSLDGGSDAKGYYRNDRGGWRRASSVKGAATGFRADRLIFDDPHNVKDADSTANLEEATRWFAKSLPTRVRNASGDVRVRVPYWVRDVHNMLEQDPDDPRPVDASATVGIMQRVHLYDIAGMILENPLLGYEILLIEMRYRGAEHPARKSPNWRPSTIGYQDWRTEPGQLADPIRFPEIEVARLEATMMLKGGSDAVAAQFDQWPLQIGGSMFQIDWLPIVEPAEVPGGVDKRGWDFAASEGRQAAATATAILRRGADRGWYIMETEFVRAGPGDVDEWIKQRHYTDPRSLDWSIPQDPGSAGKNYAQYVIREMPGRYVDATPETGSKVTRMKSVAGQAKIGALKIVRHANAELTRTQLLDFPYGELDIPDAISRAFAAHVAAPLPSEAHGGFSSETGDDVKHGESGRYDFDA